MPKCGNPHNPNLDLCSAGFIYKIDYTWFPSSSRSGRIPLDTKAFWMLHFGLTPAF
jgi:hypothetical protein